MKREREREREKETQKERAKERERERERDQLGSVLAILPCTTPPLERDRRDLVSLEFL